MPAIYLLRHGQASFGASDYDVLSDLGRRQAQAAGRELARRGLRSPVVVSGSLRRQQDTAAIAAVELGVPASAIDARFDEFDAHAAVDAHLGSGGATDGMSSGEFQRHLDVVMTTWMLTGDERWRGFADGAFAALGDVARTLPPGSDAVVVTSAGVTAVLAGRLLAAGPDGIVGMNRVSVNASITTVVSGARGLSLVTFNEHAHLVGEPGLRTNR
jgi:broad specificity phosphatase PhoE